MKILMVTMAMDIGGAETHILELSRELTRRGHDVTVASNGGAYETELREAGIAHVRVPCHSKNPVCMARSYRRLKQLILRERYDVVHAHARIPAFICEMLRRRYHFRFVTTVHWVFNPGFPYGFLTKWGERSLAVSDDIKSYLVENYGMDPGNIRVTINGIDLEKFSPNTDYSDIEREFSLNEKAERIVYISRMDTDRSLAAHRLIEIVPEIVREFPSLEVIIVGGGDDYGRVASEAEAVNKRVGRRAVIMTGARVDINRFAAAGDLFIGVSRSALEAMACGAPCIISGNEGYIGVFDEDKLERAIDTNFCCRGCGETTAERLLEDVLRVLRSPREERERLGRYCRETVRRYYSVTTMGDDAEMLYLSVIKRIGLNEVTAEDAAEAPRYLRFNPLCGRRTISDIIVSGYYGFDNMGDDSILDTLTEHLMTAMPGVRITALTRRPCASAVRYGVRCVGRMNLFSIIREMRRSRLLISGGGSLFQDSTSSKSLKYYSFIINLARRMGMKTYIYANGVGDIGYESNRRLTKTTFERADRVTLRDMESAEELVSIGVPREKLLLTADPAFMLLPYAEEEAEKLCRRFGLREGVKYFAVSLRRFEGAQRRAYDEETLIGEAVRTCAHTAKKYGAVPVFVVMQPDFDRDISRIASEKLKGEHGVDSLIIEPSSGRELYTVLCGCGRINRFEFVCGMRLHILIYACCGAIPIVGLSLDPKINSFVRSMDESCLIMIPGMTSDALVGIFDSIMDERDKYSSRIARAVSPYRMEAEGDIDAAVEMLRDA